MFPPVPVRLRFVPSSEDLQMPLRRPWCKVTMSVLPWLASCETYLAEPVDLAAHAQAFATRDRNSGRSDPGANVSPVDGMGLVEARFLALLLCTDLRAARLRAGVALASRDSAGRWDDPELSGDFARILESVAHPWLAGGSLAFTIPLLCRKAKEKEVAAVEHLRALEDAKVAEARVLDSLDADWVHWSVANSRVTLLEQLVARLSELEAIAARLANAHEITQASARVFGLERVAREIEIARGKGQAVQLEITISRWLGLPPGAQARLVGTTTIDLRLPSAEQRTAALPTSPRIALRKAEHQVAEHRLELAIAKQWPEIRLLPGFQEEDAQPRAAFGFSLPLPLWNRNAREIAVTRAERGLAAELARGEYERLVADLARAEARLAAAQAHRRRIATELVPLAGQQLADARRQAELGQLDTLLILDAVLRAHAAAMAQLDADAEEALAVVELNSLFWPELGQVSAEPVTR